MPARRGDCLSAAWSAALHHLKLCSVAALVAGLNGSQMRRAPPGISTAAALAAVLWPVLRPSVTLCTDGSLARRSTAQVLGVKHVALVTARNQRKRGIDHVQTVNSYQGRLKAWIAHLRGVATKHLHRYLTWHIIDERVQRLTAAKAPAVLVGNTAELSPERCCPNCGVMLRAA